MQRPRGVVTEESATGVGAGRPGPAGRARAALHGADGGLSDATLGKEATVSSASDSPPEERQPVFQVCVCPCSATRQKGFGVPSKTHTVPHDVEGARKTMGRNRR